MPFRALQDGVVVVPSKVPNQEPVQCPECGGLLYARGGTNRARHFYHVDETAGNSCSITSGGESATHARCVALAVVTLQETFVDQADRCAAEVDIDVSKSGSGNRTRRADAVVEFTEENRVFGNGLVVEVQHRHQDKDVRTATHDYLSVGYSVVWLSSTDFGEHELDYTVISDAFTAQDGSGYSVCNNAPKQFLSCESYNHTGEHNWGVVPSYVLTCEEEYEICTSQSCTLRRRYDEDADKYIYGSNEITTVDLPLKVLRNTVITQSPRDYVEESLKQRYRDSVLEKALADRPEIAPCPGPKGFHEWQSSKSIYDGHTLVKLHACDYCPVHLLTDFRGDERTDLFFSDHPDPEWDLLSLEADPRQCENRSHAEGSWYEFCPDCGVTNPQ